MYKTLKKYNRKNRKSKKYKFRLYKNRFVRYLLI